MSKREVLFMELMALSDEQLSAFLTSPAVVALLTEQEDRQLDRQKAV